MEELLYLLLFAAIVGVNMLIKSKGFSGEKPSESPVFLEEEITEEENSENLPEPEIQQIQPKVIEKILAKPQIQPAPQEKNQNAAAQPPQPPRKIQNVPTQSAVIWKEILDLPVALR